MINNEEKVIEFSIGINKESQSKLDIKDKNEEEKLGNINFQSSNFKEKNLQEITHNSELQNRNNLMLSPLSYYNLANAPNNNSFPYFDDPTSLSYYQKNFNNFHKKNFIEKNFQQKNNHLNENNISNDILYYSNSSYKINYEKDHALENSLLFLNKDNEKPQFQNENQNDTEVNHNESGNNIQVETKFVNEPFYKKNENNNKFQTRKHNQYNNHYKKSNYSNYNNSKNYQNRNYEDLKYYKKDNLDFPDTNKLNYNIECLQAFIEDEETNQPTNEEILKNVKDYIQTQYPNLNDINEKNKNFFKTVEIQRYPKFYIIKSFTEEDFHKSIKYNVWSSKTENNLILSQEYENCRRTNSDLLLFFSMNGSGRFSGVAKMKSVFFPEKNFNLWAINEEWKGCFDVEWIFIKDMKNIYINNLVLRNNYNYPLVFSRDCQEIEYEIGIYFLKLFDQLKISISILTHFQYYDEREDTYLNQKKN